MKQEVVTVGLDLAKSVLGARDRPRRCRSGAARACRYVDRSTYVCQPIGVYIRSVSQTPRVKPHHRTSC